MKSLEKTLDNSFKAQQTNQNLFIQITSLTLFLMGIVLVFSSYKYYSQDYVSQFINTHDYMLIVNMLLEFGDNFNHFIIDMYKYIEINHKIDLTIYKTFYAYFWDFRATILIFLSIYIKTTGTPLQRIKKIVQFSLPIFLTLLIEIKV